MLAEEVRLTIGMKASRGAHKSAMVPPAIDTAQTASADATFPASQRLILTECTSHQTSQKPEDGKDGKVIRKGHGKAEQRKRRKRRKVHGPPAPEFGERRK